VTTELTYLNLTPEQQRLHDHVLNVASIDGADCKDVLDVAEASPSDKAAVADVLGGPGAGDEYRTPEPTDGYRDRKHLLKLAEQCEAGADQLTYEGDHAAEVLAERGYPNADAQEWANRKTAAAAAARQYAQGLRAEAAGMGPGDRPTDERIREAEKVADAANLGGILIDSRRSAEIAAANPWTSPEARQAAKDYAQAKADTIERTSVFEHVAEPGQVPFWQLGRTDQVVNSAEPVDVDEP
jgi:hypothetical protein